MLEEQLKKFGLTEKEAKTYLSLLELGESAAADVAKKADVNRSTAYVVLDALEKKGLVSNIQSAGKQTFRAAPPEKLEQIAADMLKKHEDIFDSIKNAVPKLKGVDKYQDLKPEITIYQGKEGLVDAFNSTLESKEKILRVASSASAVTKLLPPLFFPKYIRNRIKAGVSLKSIHPYDKFATTLLKSVSMKTDDACFVEAEDFNFNADFAIFDDTVAFMTADQGGYAISIESKEIAEITKTIFDLAHEEAKRKSKHRTLEGVK